MAGVRVGDAAAGIERGAVTEATDDVPVERLTYINGALYRHGPDATRVEISLAERIDSVLRRGGALHCVGITLHVAAGRIERIRVAGAHSLASLKVRNEHEEDIARRLGPAGGLERDVDHRLHHYPDRGLVVVWHSRYDRLEYVVLGPDPWRVPRLGARELLAELLDAFGILQPPWLEPSDGIPRIRYQRIAALARALELGAVPELMAGEFLDGELSEGRCEVIDDIAARGPRVPPRCHCPGMLFTELLHYRNAVQRLVRAETVEGLETDDPAMLGMIATQKHLGAQIAALMVDVDRWLCTLMDPAQRTFGLKELIARYGWPDVDLRALEREARLIEMYED